MKILSLNIGVLVEDIRRYPTPDIINGISEYAEQNGYKISTCAIGNDLLDT